MYIKIKKYIKKIIIKIFNIKYDLSYHDFLIELQNYSLVSKKKIRLEFYNNNIIINHENYKFLYNHKKQLASMLGHHDLSIDFLKKNIKKETILIDIGSSIGYFSINLAKHLKYVYCFEPDQSRYLFLNQHIELNNINNIESHNLAIGSKSKKIFKTINLWEHDYILDDKTKNNDFEEVIQESLDKFVSKRNFNKNFKYFVKIDVEGFKYECLIGMQNFILNYDCLLFIEINENHLNRYEKSFLDIFEFLSKNNYNCNHYIDSKKISKFDENTKNLKNFKNSFNYIFTKNIL